MTSRLLNLAPALSPQRWALARGSRLLGLVLTGVLLSACAVGPDYQRPELAVPQQFNAVDGWTQANPSDALERGAWWELYADPQLNALVAKLNSNNQSVAQAEAQFRQAQALVRNARGAFLPSADLSVGKTRSSQGTGSSNSSLTSSSSGIRDTLNAQVGVSWEADVWGKLRRGLEANEASAEASYADLAAMRLSQQSELVQNYLQLRVIDQQKRLLEATVEAYERSLKMSENQYRAGISGKDAVAQAQTQLRNTQASLIDLIWQRAQFENAIAVLTGQPPTGFKLAEINDIPKLPAIPVSVPSQLLERRPDIASAERSIIAANANIGVAKAAYYPDFSLSLSGGYSSSQYQDWISVPNRFWSVGPKISLPLFDGGQRSAEVDRNEAVYDQTVAKYRQTVLDGFREVENYRIQLKVLGDETVVQEQALESARESLRLTTNQYKAGLIAYLDVVNVQTTALSTERSVLNLLQSRLIASVQLIAALGGGWDGKMEVSER
ncbi:efflux transporter outer membrane subunit [Pseudomonas helleri]|jgi:NodT family efflux transporter outer membrane factor (OMF) lipoprotein|uniref:Efflux transporter outer membrane subunit n=1 Tax=Pseudomonas helleri TaxID=1608996 RepID=A0A6A7YAK3_9PSED|nr:efflux transporter outer membrane subunit [Pseudomonas helleri]MQT29725.1 efflux transporter outer membrane subunit [Pseudomonas helleri]MQT46612.1 efflux transporter outer membrane subunit [Pseudomonas helleri]MQT88839.1 efflux transporter outer membrane subunit [Pseudomonas helleri]MQT95389.1 efflux transporter outer membrane subunit [Pseudomonas helleri]MQU30660.1 efflux transporter outer membrane subunit [Pseudomonas helleri]